MTGVLLYLATKRGARIVKKTEETLELVKQNAGVANDISGNLNATIQKKQGLLSISLQKAAAV